MKEKINTLLSKVSHLLLCLVLVILFLSPKESYSQNIKRSNKNKINRLKSTVKKSKIENYLVGYWNFKYLKDSSGKVINERIFSLDTLSVVEDIYRPDFVFLNSRKYLIINKEKDTIDNGTWYYDDKEKALYLKYEKPKYNVPIEKLSPELLKRLKENKRLFKTDGRFIEIHRIAKNELIFIEHKPHDEFELKYNLRVYVKN